MKKRKIYGLAIVVLALSITLGSFFANDKYSEIYLKYEDSLDEQKQGQLLNWVAAMQFGQYEWYYEEWMSSGAMASGTVNAILLNEGYYTEHYQELKDLGYLPEGYTLPSGNTSKSEKTQPEAVATPEPVTTEKCTEKVMWATGTVNVRENGSTSYKKVGSLKAGEQVTVTGTDSTGWYEIRLQDGTVGHVSDKYLTEDDPSVSAAPKTDAETPQTEPTEETTTGAEPTEETAATPDVEEVEAVEEDADNSTEPVIEETSAAPDPSATTVPEEDTEDLNTDPSPAVDVQEEKTNDGLKTIIFVAVGGLVVLGLGICTVTYLHRKKK